MTTAPRKQDARQNDRKDSTRWLSMVEAGELLGVSHKTLRRRVATGELPAYRMRGGRIFRFRQEDVEALLVRVPTVQRDDRGRLI